MTHVTADAVALRRVPKLAAVAVVLIGALAGSVAANAGARVPFEAMFDGTFTFGAGPGESHLFVVEETGAGDADGFGAFDFMSSVLQNDAKVPRGCAEPTGSSIGVEGWATLTFADGDIIMRRSRGGACLDFSDPPVVVVTEVWRIVGGTGTFSNAVGWVRKELTGDLTTFPIAFVDATLSGFIQLK